MIKKYRCMAVIACLFLLISAGLSAQTSQELPFDTIVSGNLREGGEQWYSIRSIQAGFVTVETSGSTDTLLEAYDASRNYIDQNDDGGDDCNARLQILAQAGTTYLLKLTSFENDGGAYRIWAIYDPMTVPTELHIDSIVSGNIRAGENYLYSVISSQTGFITVETSGNTDTYLQAYDASNQLLASDDDGGEDGNARLRILAEAGKTYLFRLRGFNKSESGSYRIWAISSPIPQSTEIRFDSIVSGNLREGVEQWYSVRASRSGVVTVGTMGSLDTFLEAYDSSYSFITSDDDGGGGSNAQVEIPVEAGKTYYFMLRGFGSSESGPYRIWASFESFSNG